MSRESYVVQNAVQEDRKTLVLQQAIDIQLARIEEKVIFFVEKFGAATKPADQSCYQRHLHALRACKMALEDPNDITKKGLLQNQLDAYRRKRGGTIHRFFATVFGLDHAVIDNILESTAYLLRYSSRRENEPFDSVMTPRSAR